MHKSKFFTFVFSLVPGVGHLYLGLNKRGLQLMVSAFISISLISSFPTVFPFVLAIIWFYGLFDALQKATIMNYYARKQSAQAVHAADSPETYPNFSQLDQTLDPFEAIMNENKINPLWMGIGSIVIGSIVLLRMLLPDAWDWLFRGHRSGILLAFLMIGFGLWQINKQRTTK